jgi:hypothetical protein
MLCAQSGVDCLRAADADTLRMLLAELGTKKLILIDTPGVEVASKIEDIKGCAKDLSCHLILPADVSSTTARKYLLDARLQWNSFMVSRMDESTQPWALIQLLCEHPVALSAASTSPLTGDAAKALLASELVALALKGLGLDEIVNEQVKAAADIERDLTVMTAAQALVQRIEKNPHAS